MQLIYPLYCWWTEMLFPLGGHCKHCCYKCTWTLSSIHISPQLFIFKYYKHRKLQLLYSEHLYSYDFACISKQVVLSLAFQNMYHRQKFTVYLWGFLWGKTYMKRNAFTVTVYNSLSLRNAFTCVIEISNKI